ncbi:phenylalanyl-tRNA synthetase subunit alpha [Rufibacter radiotolerans]|uniref:Phenylalanyl-tRNA synthetase subunit alpha n=1 Tax=Rufibacter radiotolerans TaxID=1379910 RepID=A0A0H4W8M5_9BACT|nr:zinc-dependent peptidase [Rufibacter radiotolerans]AKQ46791.1 phenylalanyl-tRNA synthetase subunit alpha [Rufibacter radiotolerans]
MGILAFVFFVVVVVGLFYRWATRKTRRRTKVLAQEFPAEWRKILSDRVGFYHTLKTEEEKYQFEKMIQLFLSEKRITGIEVVVDDLTKVLVAASAVIPIYGFKDWEYPNLGEVLVFPGSLERFKHGDSEAVSEVLGRVNPFQNDHYVTLSKPALEKGFNDMADRQNVGIHEFAHLLDQADGEINGRPTAYLPDDLVQPWEELMYRKIKQIKKGESDINPYGATNEAEFFAVATEYFFEKPGQLAENHPGLYKMLTQIFQQNPKRRFKLNFRELLNPYGKRLGRNEPCPCGSAEKYKNCCLPKKQSA